MKVFEFLKTMFNKIFKGAIQEQLDILVPIAIEAVKAVEADPTLIASSVKRTAALAMIMAKIAKAEKPVINRLMNLALEIAVVEVKGVK